MLDDAALGARGEFDELPRALDILRSARNCPAEATGPGDVRVLLFHKSTAAVDAIVWRRGGRDAEVDVRPIARQVFDDPVAIDLHRDLARNQRIVLARLEPALEILLSR